MSEPPSPEFVRPRTEHQAPVHLAEADPSWPDQFARVAARVETALGAGVVMLEHVGSTSVPELPAKPVLDVVLVVADPRDEAAYVPALEAAGFLLHLREPGWHEHRLLKGASPTVNLHVFGRGCPEVERMLLFRDRLRRHPEERQRYARTKRELAARTWAYVQDYADAKSEVVEAIITRAVEERRRSGSAPSSPIGGEPAEQEHRRPVDGAGGVGQRDHAHPGRRLETDPAEGTAGAAVVPVHPTVRPWQR